MNAHVPDFTETEREIVTRVLSQRYGKLVPLELAWKPRPGFRGGYNRNGARLILAEVAREHGQEAADGLIRKLRLDVVFGIEPGTRFGPTYP